MIIRVIEESAIVEEFACVFVNDCKSTMYFFVDALHSFGQDGNGLGMRVACWEQVFVAGGH